MQLKPGTTLQDGKYRIVRLLGKGGFGITYVAWQVDPQTGSKHKVALKEFFMKDCCERQADSSLVYVPTHSNAALVNKFRGKFLREANMMKDFGHPHIVHVLDVFEENGTAYYAMSYLPLGSLKDQVKTRGPLSEASAEMYIRQVADALSYIHSQHTVHLDVKPANILLDSFGKAVLIDFGISKHYDKAGEQTTSTPVGVSKGFSPLEQGRDGDVSQFGPSTDIYALGATLYYLITGFAPPEATVVYEDGLMRPAGISDRMWKVIKASMRPLRKDRPQSIPEFLDLLGDDTVVVDPPPPPLPPPDPPGKGGRKKRSLAWLWVLLGIIAAIVAGLLFIPGSIIVNSQPSGAVIRLDGENTYMVTPAVLKASPGGHSIRLELDGYEDYYAYVTVVATQEEYLNCRLDIKPGSIQVITEPSGVAIWLDGEETDRTTPFILENIDPGEHSIRLVRKGYREYEGTVTVTAGQRVTLTKTLKAIPEGYVDMDLPSGTLWKERNESGFYSFAEASAFFGDSLPDETQYRELKNACDWSWTGSGYRVTGPNGNSIYFPASGWRWSTGSVSNEGTHGYYWSSSAQDSDKGWSLALTSKSSGLVANGKGFAFTVRLVHD